MANRTIPLPIGALVEAGISPNQWFILYLLHYQLWDDYVSYQQGPKIELNAIHPDELNDLHQRLFLYYEPKEGDHAKTSPINFRVSERFTELLGHITKTHIPGDGAFYPDMGAYQKSLEKPKPFSLARNGESEQPKQDFDGLEFYDELFDAYPSHFPVDGRLMSARSGDQDHMAVAYTKALLRKGALSHPEILSLVEWAKMQSPSMITMGLKKFIDSQEWIGLKQLRDSGAAQIAPDLTNDI
jgi:hypothetical protein